MESYQLFIFSYETIAWVGLHENYLQILADINMALGEWINLPQVFFI